MTSSTDVLPHDAAADRWIPIAEIARPHGVLGELRLRLFNDQSRLIEKGSVVRLLPPKGGEAREAVVKGARYVSGALLVTLDLVPDRTQAEGMRQYLVALPRSKFPPADPGEFYACDLIGASVFGPDGVVVARVEELVDYPSTQTLRVRSLADQAHVWEIPLLDQFIKLVDVEKFSVEILLEALELAT